MPYKNKFGRKSQHTQNKVKCPLCGHEMTTKQQKAAGDIMKCPHCFSVKVAEFVAVS